MQREPEPRLQPINFSELRGWSQEDHHAALHAFRQACAVSHYSASAWLNEGFSDLANYMEGACKRARQNEAIRAPKQFFEHNFSAHQLYNHAERTGLITGYYTPVLEASLKQDNHYRYPVYAMPPEAKQATTESPYLSRSEIEAGALQNRGLELVYVHDPVDLFFLHVQGSGFVSLPDGSVKQLRYAGKNHQPYVAIGKVLKQLGELEPDDISMKTIRQWLQDHPDRRDELFHQNASYVFFTLEDETVVRGAHGSPLTAQRSIAVDPRYLPYGVPVWLNTSLPCTANTACPCFANLVMTQDTGSAIKGPIRADLFYGMGDTAEYLAGHMQSAGSMVLLLPKPEAADEQ